MAMSNYLEIRNDDNVIQVNDSTAPLCTLQTFSLSDYFVQERTFHMTPASAFNDFSGKLRIYSLPISDGCAWFLTCSSDRYAGVFMNINPAFYYHEGDDGMYSHKSAGVSQLVGVFAPYSFNFCNVEESALTAEEAGASITAIRVGGINTLSKRMQQQIAKSGNGLAIWDAESNLVFSSEYPPLAFDLMHTERNIDTNEMYAMQSNTHYLGFDETPRTFDHQIAFSASVNFCGANPNLSGSSEAKLTDIEYFRRPAYLLSKTVLRPLAVMGCREEVLTEWNGTPVTYRDGVELDVPAYGTAVSYPRICNYTSYMIVNASRIG